MRWATIAAAVEAAATGLILLIAPVQFGRLILGAELSEPGQALGRLTGIAGLRVHLLAGSRQRARSPERARLQSDRNALPLLSGCGGNVGGHAAVARCCGSSGSVYPSWQRLAHRQNNEALPRMDREQYQQIAVGAATVGIVAALASGRLPRWLRVIFVAGLVLIAAGAGVYAYRYAKIPTTLTVAADPKAKPRA